MGAIEGIVNRCHQVGGSKVIVIIKTNTGNPMEVEMSSADFMHATNCTADRIGDTLIGLRAKRVKALDLNMN